MHKPKIVWPVIYLAAFFEQRDRHLHLSLSLPPITSLLHLLRTCGCFFLLLNRSVALLASPTQPGDQNQMQSLMGGSAYRPDREGRRWEGVLQGYSAVWRRGHPGNANIWANCIEENIFVPRNVVFFLNPHTLTLRPCGLSVGLNPSPGHGNWLIVSLALPCTSQLDQGVYMMMNPDAGNGQNQRSWLT